MIKKITHYLHVIEALLFSFFHTKKTKIMDYKVSYIFLNKKSNDLLVIFPAVSKKPMYNYLKTLKHKNICTLFLRDDFCKERGTYFLGKKGNMNLLEVVDVLLDKIVCYRKFDSIATIGSSKGGSSALFFALTSRHNVDKCIIGGPQFQLGTYFYKHAGKQWLTNICGECNITDQKYLDNYCESILSKTDKKPKVFLLSSSFEDDFHIEDINKLVSLLRNKQIDLILTDAKYLGHGGLADAYKSYLSSVLREQYNV